MADRQDTIQQILAQEIIPFPKSNRFKNLTNERHGRLVILRFAGVIKPNARWNCVCDCGNPAWGILGYHLTRDATLSCGCIQKEFVGGLRRTHGKSQTPEYRVYLWMLERCYRPTATGYKDYGARGITVCDRWIDNNGFLNFLADMGEKPTPKHSIERIDTNGNYCPENCKWATRKEQARNTRRTVRITYDGRTQSLADWADEYGLPYGILYARLSRLRWDIHKSLTLPIRQRPLRRLP